METKFVIAETKTFVLKIVVVLMQINKKNRGNHNKFRANSNRLCGKQHAPCENKNISCCNKIVAYVN